MVAKGGELSYESYPVYGSLYMSCLRKFHCFKTDIDKLNPCYLLSSKICRPPPFPLHWPLNSPIHNWLFWGRQSIIVLTFFSSFKIFIAVMCTDILRIEARPPHIVPQTYAGFVNYNCKVMNVCSYCSLLAYLLSRQCCHLWLEHSCNTHLNNFPCRSWTYIVAGQQLCKIHNYRH